MRREQVWRHVSRKLVILLLTVALPPAATLVWLGLQLFAQDRALLGTVVAERHRTETQAVVNALDQAVATAERLLDGGDLPAGMVRLTLGADRVTASPAHRVLWLPVVPFDRTDPPTSFLDAERLEYGGQAARALTIYEARARSGVPATRAGALLRLARVHRHAGRPDAAIDAYRRLEGLGEIQIIGAPAALQARRARIAVLEDAGRRDDAAREAAGLRADLLGGRWMLDRPAWELTVRDIERWTGHAVPHDRDRERFSHLAAHLWAARGAGLPASRSTVAIGDVPVTLLTRATGREVTAVAALPAVVDAWVRAAADRASVAASRVAVDGMLAVTGAPLRGDVAPVSASATGLPWTVIVTMGDASPEMQAFDRRRQQLSLALVAILAMLAGGSYFLWRVMQRELAVGRLQTEFVAAVSHEFRTPLTSLRHVTDLLDESDDIPRERRGALYGALGRNVERLRRLVESLLDFSRMESGRKPYDLRPIDAVAMVASVVDDFRRDGMPAGFAVTLDVETPGPLMFRADPSSLTHAVWNLLDNAVKYSPGGRDVHVTVSRRAADIAIAVRDRGLGIPTRERKDIFRRFVRGEHARQLGITGTGLGLAMVAHIAEAHHGRVEVESEEGAGSTFRIVLPSLA
jgi:signal transduction histidine kinase